MKYTFDIEKNNMGAFYIATEKNEDPDTFHRYSKLLQIQNPIIDFKERADRGDFNSMSDEEFDNAFRRIKTVTDLFFKKDYSVNVFKLNAMMINYIAGSKNRIPGKPVTVQDFLDDNGITGKDRRDLYGFISSEGNDGSNDRAAKINPMGCPAAFFLPGNKRTHFIFLKDRTIAINPFEEYWEYEAEFPDGDTRKIHSDLPESFQKRLITDRIILRNIKETVILDTGATDGSVTELLDRFKNTRVEYYRFRCSDECERLTYNGVIEACEVIKTDDSTYIAARYIK